METLILFAAWILFISNLVLVLIMPAIIGRPKTGVHSFWEWLGNVMGCAFVTLVVGRVFGWW